jgi:hypothetical protein
VQGASTAPAGGTLQKTQDSPEYESGPTSREFKFFVTHNFAGAIGTYEKGSTNISTNAVRFATLGPTGTPGSTLNSTAPGGSTEGSQVNAFRHAIWQATIASRFGQDAAKGAGDAHEENPKADLSQRTFTNLADADQAVDLNNNVIGRAIAAQNPNASPKELAEKTLETYHKDGLFQITAKNPDGSFKIERVKLSEAQYNQMKSLIGGVNDNGFTPKKQAEYDAKMHEIAETTINGSTD